MGEFPFYVGERMILDKKNYEFIRPIATNEEADIYLCQELEADTPIRSVVLKVLHSNWSENQEAVRQLQADIQLLARLQNRNIADIYDVIAIRGRTTVIMEEINGIDLKGLISLMKDMKQRIPLRVSLEIVANVASALDEAYNKPPSSKEWPLRVMHGNLKPSNIMLQPDGLVRILDFGVVHSELGSRESSTRELQYEEREYIAPERLFFEPQGPSSDVYSLTMTLFEMIAGKAIQKIGTSEQEHEKRVNSYCKRLLSPMRLGDEFKDTLSQFLKEGLAYNSGQRPTAEDFSKKARMLSQGLKGISSVEWSERAVAHFCEADADLLQGGLQGKVLGEDTQIYTKQNDDSVIRDEVDTAIMRRGAQLELSHTFREEAQPLASSLNFLEESEKTLLNVEVEEFATFESSQTLSPLSEDYEAKTVSALNLEVTSRDLNFDGSASPPMVINPQAMVVVEESAEDHEAREESSKKGILLITTSMIGILIVVLIFGYLYQNQEISGLVGTEIVQVTKPEKLIEAGIVIHSEQKNAKKLEVRCGSERWKGSDEVVVPFGEWKNCMIIGRDASRHKILVEIEELKEGTYTCFTSGDTCQWEE